MLNTENDDDIAVVAVGGDENVLHRDNHRMVLVKIELPLRIDRLKTKERYESISFRQTICHLHAVNANISALTSIQ